MESPVDDFLAILFPPSLRLPLCAISGADLRKDRDPPEDATEPGD